jgi:hypothetical protein
MHTHDNPVVAAHFWSRVAVAGPDECWHFLGYLDEDGYGWFSAKGWAGRAHRIAYTLVYGPPGTLAVCHSCDERYGRTGKGSRSCCNPAHLWLGTNQENTADRHRKGRSAKGNQFSHRNYARGERSGVARLTEGEVIELRRLHAEGLGQSALARRFSRPVSTIHNILTRRTWKHVP